MHGKAYKAARAAALVMLAATLFSACGRQAGGEVEQTVEPAQSVRAYIERSPAPYRHTEVLNAFPSPPDPDGYLAYDFRWCDVSSLDLAPYAELLPKVAFNNNTVWPQTLPDGFDPALILENSKNPGLGVRALHERGIDGRGVSIGIIDQTLLTTHEEYADCLVHYEEIHALEYPASMHGAAVSSLAVGKTCGIAPAAALYYIGCGVPEGDDAEKDFTQYMAQAVHRLLDINLELPAEQKIRVISISKGFLPSNGGYSDMMAAIDRAKQEGVFVVTASLGQEYGCHYAGLARIPTSDGEDVESYGIVEGALGMDSVTGDEIYFLMQRTHADFSGDGDYAYEPRGAISWIMPYVSGLYALCCQVKPDITPDEFWQAVTETAYEQQVQNGAVQQPIHIVNPTELLAKVEGR